MKSPEEIVGLMLQSDEFSKWLEIKVDVISLGECQLSTQIKSEMLNGFHIAHGGISYSLADSALAFASNSYGYKAVSIETSISHTKKSQLGDCLVATVKELSRSKKFGIYEVVVRNQMNEIIALFKGTVAISEKAW